MQHRAPEQLRPVESTVVRAHDLRGHQLPETRRHPCGDVVTVHPVLTQLGSAYEPLLALDECGERIKCGCGHAKCYGQWLCNLKKGHGGDHDWLFVAGVSK